MIFQTLSNVRLNSLSLKFQMSTWSISNPSPQPPSRHPSLATPINPPAWLCNKIDLGCFPWLGQKDLESMPGILSSMEQNDSSSCGSLTPLWSSNEYNNITIGDERAEAHELVLVPGVEPNDEQNTFLMERLLSSLRQVAECAWPRVDDRGVPKHVLQKPQDTVDQHPQA